MNEKFDSIEACVFDAYGTLFDVHSAVGRHRAGLGEHADAVSAMWRTKQLEYTWLRSLMKDYAPFWQVTGDALDFALDMFHIADADLRENLMQAYLTLKPYPEVVEVLTALNAAGYKCAILTNGSPEMIEAAVASAGLEGLLEENLSVQSVEIFKPDASVYKLATDAFSVKPDAISFQSSNAWDAVGAAHFGFKVAWINRFGQRPERLNAQPDAELSDLTGLPDLLGIQ